MTTPLIPLPTAAAETMTLNAHGVWNRGDRMLETLNRWHDQTHPGGFDHCDLQPCHALHTAYQDGAEPGELDFCSCGLAMVCLACNGVTVAPEAETAAADLPDVSAKP